MGTCLSTRVKDERPLQNGCDSNSGNNKNVSAINVLSSEADIPVLAEGEILQSPNLKSFLYSELKAATRGFNPESLVGQGAFGFVYKGWMAAAPPKTGMTIAVKVLNPKGAQGQQEWLAEIMFLGQLRHPNLVKLIGYCLEDNYRLLVYEYMANGSLENHLFEGASNFQLLSWDLRLKVAIGAANGLAFLHEKAHVIHRDFKISDILLDMNYNAKLSDFGLAKNGPTCGRSHVSTRIVSTSVHVAPEYLRMGHVSVKSDVYSFGVVLLELLTGKRPKDYSRPNGEQNLVQWAKPYLSNKRKVFRLLDARTIDKLSPTAAVLASNLVVQCLSAEPGQRPDMVEVLKELEVICRTNDGDRSSSAPRSQNLLEK